MKPWFGGWIDKFAIGALIAGSVIVILRDPGEVWRSAALPAALVIAWAGWQWRQHR